MHGFLRFWWRCACLAAKGNTAFANDWTWLFGIPILAGLLAYFHGAQDTYQMTFTGNDIADGVIAAFVAFLMTWCIAFAVRFFNAPAVLYRTEKERADILVKKLVPKINVDDPHCYTHPKDARGLALRIYRIRIHNTSPVEMIRNCQVVLDTMVNQAGISTKETGRAFKRGAG
jgi:hypothetical protein